MVTTYANVPYTPTISSDGTTATFNPQSSNIYFPNSYEDVTFTAYAPYKAADDNSISTLPGTDADGLIPFTAEEIHNANTGTTEQQAIDFLYATAKANVASPTVNFTFNHVMTKLKLVFTMGGSTLTFADLQNATFKLWGINLKGTFDMTSGEIATTADTDVTDGWNFTDRYYTDDTDNSTRTYELIVPPQDLSARNMVIHLNINGVNLMAQVSDNLQGGYEYTYNITVNEDGSSIAVTDVSVSVSDWGDGGTNTLTTQ